MSSLAVYWPPVRHQVCRTLRACLKFSEQYRSAPTISPFSSTPRPFFRYSIASGTQNSDEFDAACALIHAASAISPLPLLQFGTTCFVVCISFSLFAYKTQLVWGAKAHLCKFEKNQSGFPQSSIT